MIYQTRRMVAMQQMRHERRNLSAGDEFDATEIDARYLEKTGRAQFVMQPVEQNPVDNAAVAVPRRRGRPPRQITQQIDTE